MRDTETEAFYEKISIVNLLEGLSNVSNKKLILNLNNLKYLNKENE